MTQAPASTAIAPAIIQERFRLAPAATRLPSGVGSEVFRCVCWPQAGQGFTYVPEPLHQSQVTSCRPAHAMHGAPPSTGPGAEPHTGQATCPTPIQPTHGRA